MPDALSFGAVKVSSQRWHDGTKIYYIYAYIFHVFCVFNSRSSDLTHCSVYV